MGLLLSILVSCVGVVELLAIYGNVRRAVVQAQQGDGGGMDGIKANYMRDLGRERDRLRREIARLEGNAEVQNSSVKQVEIQETVRVKDFDLPRIVSVSETPRNATDISTVNKPDVSKIQSNLEDTPPLPIKDKHTQHVFPSYIDSSAKKVINLNTPDETHPIVITDEQQHTTNYEEDFHREPSPYPTYDRLAPRNSLCSELIKDPISVSEVDEENYKTSQKAEDILKSNFDNPDYWGKSLRPERKSKSRSRSRTPEILLKDRLDFEERSRSKSPNLPQEQQPAEKTGKAEIETITRYTLEDFDNKPQDEGIRRRKSRRGKSKKNKSTEEVCNLLDTSNIDDFGEDAGIKCGQAEVEEKEVVMVQDEQNQRNRIIKDEQQGGMEERDKQFTKEKSKVEMQESSTHFSKEKSEEGMEGGSKYFSKEKPEEGMEGESKYFSKEKSEEGMAEEIKHFIKDKSEEGMEGGSKHFRKEKFEEKMEKGSKHVSIEKSEEGSRKGIEERSKQLSKEKSEDEIQEEIMRSRFEDNVLKSQMEKIGATKEEIPKEKLSEEFLMQEKCVNEETSQLVEQKYWKRSPSPFQKILDVYASSSSLDQDNEESSASSRVTIVELDEEIDAEVLNSVDGINKKQKQTNEDNKRQFKKKRNKRTRTTAPVSSEQSSFSDEGSGNVVAVDANARDGNEGMRLEEVQQAGPSRKPGEPFWVKQK